MLPNAPSWRTVTCLPNSSHSTSAASFCSGRSATNSKDLVEIDTVHLGEVRKTHDRTALGLLELREEVLDGIDKSREATAKGHKQRGQRVSRDRQRLARQDRLIPDAHCAWLASVVERATSVKLPLFSQRFSIIACVVNSTRALEGETPPSLFSSASAVRTAKSAGSRSASLTMASIWSFLLTQTRAATSR